MPARVDGQHLFHQSMQPALPIQPDVRLYQIGCPQGGRDLALGVDEGQIVVLPFQQQGRAAVGRGQQFRRALPGRKIVVGLVDWAIFLLDPSGQELCDGQSGGFFRRGGPRRSGQKLGRLAQSGFVVGDDRQGLTIGHERTERDEQASLAATGNARRADPRADRPQALGQSAAGKYDAILAHDVRRIDLRIAAQLGHVYPPDPIDMRRQISAIADKLAGGNPPQPLLVVGGADTSAPATCRNPRGRRARAAP